MKNMKILCNALWLTSLTLSGTAMAYGGYGYRHEGVGIYIGTPYIYPYYPAYPYAYYPPVIIAPPAPPTVYIEQQQPVQIAPSTPQQAAPTNNFWYHCGNPDGYYPYIKECPSGWQKVTPTPPSQP